MNDIYFENRIYVGCTKVLPEEKRDHAQYWGRENSTDCDGFDRDQFNYDVELFKKHTTSYDCPAPHPFTDGQDVTGLYKLVYQYLHMGKEWKDCGEAFFNSIEHSKRIIALPVQATKAIQNTEGKVRSAGTAMQELIEWISDTAPDRITEVRDKATSLLTKERQDIIDAYSNGYHNASNGTLTEINTTADQYFTQTFKH
jgi:hypothetical protein